MRILYIGKSDANQQNTEGPKNKECKAQWEVEATKISI